MSCPYMGQERKLGGTLESGQVQEEVCGEGVSSAKFWAEKPVKTRHFPRRRARSQRRKGDELSEGMKQRPLQLHRGLGWSGGK